MDYKPITILVLSAGPLALLPTGVSLVQRHRRQLLKIYTCITVRNDTDKSGDMVVYKLIKKTCAHIPLVLTTCTRSGWVDLWVRKKLDTVNDSGENTKGGRAGKQLGVTVRLFLSEGSLQFLFFRVPQWARFKGRTNMWTKKKGRAAA